jgi:tRNA pseudouridine55 synthase
VGFVRGRSRVKRVGHAGTLDPLATGVLPVCIGQATRVVEYLVDATKTYVADVTLGVVTDTYDAEGEVVASADASGVTREAIDGALEAFRGGFEQVPPAYSDIKRNGVPL